MISEMTKFESLASASEVIIATCSGALHCEPSKVRAVKTSVRFMVTGVGEML